MLAAYPFTDTTLVASDSIAAAANPLQIDAPTVLELHDDNGTVAAQGVVGGLRFSARPGRTSETLHGIPASSGGRLFLPCAGHWIVTLQ